MKQVIAVMMLLPSLAALHAADQSSPDVVFGRDVKSFDSLSDVTKYDDLKTWGLVGPGQHEHQSGKNLVLLALKANSISKGDWVSSLGLLGVAMLHADIYSAQGYKSLFTANLVADSDFKMYGTTLIGNNQSILRIQSKSIVGRREAAIFGVANAFFGRYCSSPAAQVNNFNESLKQALKSGLTVYLELKAKGYDDKTLRDALNIARASLESDKVLNEDVAYNELGLWQVHQDALAAALQQMREKKWEFSETTFEAVLKIEMSIRGLVTSDGFLIPENEQSFAVLVKLVESDLNGIEIK
jgi:hypothetical protein